MEDAGKYIVGFIIGVGVTFFVMKHTDDNSKPRVKKEVSKKRPIFAFRQKVVDIALARQYKK